jgi:pimeloyl-ACP methyl ester carboxylesterase
MTWTATEFESEEATLRGRLYLPDRLPAPIVVMAHGFTATVPMVLDRYAEAFQEAGIAALAYDHRGFGRSDGEPPGEINAWMQTRGYRSAVAHARGLPGIDPRRVALWGDSISAAEVMAVAALDPEIAAVVVQVPAFGDDLPADDPGDLRFAAMRRHLLEGTLRGPSAGWSSMTVVSPDQVALPSALLPLTAFRWFIEYGARHGADWVNRATFTQNPEAPPWESLLWAAHVDAPTLLVMSPDDEMEGAASAVTRAAYERLRGPREIVEVEGGHFGILFHPSPVFDQASAAEVAFAARTLLPSRS